MVKRIFYYSRSNKSFIFQLLSILISLIIFVLSIITLNYEQLAIWQILSSMLFLALLFELGFGNIFLIKIKQSIDNKKSKDFLLYINSSIFFGKILFAIVFLFISFFLYFYLSNLKYEILNFNYYFKNGLICSLAVAIEILYLSRTYILKAHDLVDKVYFALFFQRLAHLFSLIIMLYFELSLYAFTLSFLLSSIVKNNYLHSFTSNLFDHVNDFSLKQKLQTLRKILKPSIEFGIVQVGNFITFRSSLYLVNYFIGLKAGASFGILQQIISIGNSLSYSIFNSNFPKIIENLNNKNFNVVKRESLKNNLLSILIFILCYLFSISLFILNNHLILIPFSFEISLSVIFLYGIACALELNHNFYWNYLTNFLKIDFFKSAIFSGIFILVIQFIITYMYKSIFLLILVHFTIQISYNNWKWPVYFYTQILQKKK